MNQEQVNDRAKLMMHRLMARRLAAEPRLVADARAVLNGWRESRPYDVWMDEWEALLRLPMAILRREITRRTEVADRLRISSPFAVVERLRITDEAIRRRLWQVAKRGRSGRSRISGAPSGR